MRCSSFFALATAFALSGVVVVGAEPPYSMGSQVELLVDDFLIGTHTGVKWQGHQPEAREVVLTCDKLWEGNTSAYYTFFQDGDIYRAYYRGSHFDEVTKKGGHPEFTCYAESRDGITWTKPSLGLFEFQGSKANNIVWAGAEGTHNFSPFKDTHPQCAPEARYKAVSGGTMKVNGKKKEVLYAYQSPDGLNWKLLTEKPVITHGAFDSQNIAYFDELRGEYRAYWRYFTEGTTDENGWKPAGLRAIRTATSNDFVYWENEVDLSYDDTVPEQLYTNAVLPYFRAPQLFIGFPTRYQPKHQQVEPIFMSSRDGAQFKRWSQELIPITAPKDRDGNRSNYMTRGLLALPGQEREISVYATEAYYKGPGSRVRRFVFRTDGFVSARAEGKGDMVTKPLTFTGNELIVNLVSKGRSAFELQDEAGQPIPGFTLNDCMPFSGDEVAHCIQWKGGSLPSLVGKTIRLRAALEQADWYSFQFK